MLSRTFDSSSQSRRTSLASLSGNRTDPLRDDIRNRRRDDSRWSQDQVARRQDRSHPKRQEEVVGTASTSAEAALTPTVEGSDADSAIPSIDLLEEEEDMGGLQRRVKDRDGRKGTEKEREAGAKKKKVYVSRSQENRAMSEGYGGRELYDEVDRKRKEKKAKKKEEKVEKKTNYKTLEIPTTITVERFARLVNMRFKTLLYKLDRMGIPDLRADRVLTADDSSLIAMELGYEPVIDEEASFDIYPDPPCSDPSVLQPRPPIVTIMGHVDHGKTSLLDALRNARVAKGEAGGITQHIGAFSVSLSAIRHNSALRAKELDPSIEVPPIDATAGETYDKITFLDTPGHEAFSSMRARGATVTDVVVLVVAADDGVMPQTEEVIGLLKKERQGEGLGVVVAITKVDKAESMVEDVKNQIMGEGLKLEEFGGDIPCVEVSAVTGQGLKELVETIATIAELKEVKAERDGVRCQGWVLEAKKDPKRGVIATILNTRGTLKFANHLIAGSTYGRVREMTLSTGRKVTSLLPGEAAEITGWKDLPAAGDEVIEHQDLSAIHKALKNRERRAERAQALKDLEVIEEKRKQESRKQEVVEDLKREWWKAENQKEAKRRMEEMNKEEEEERAKTKELVLVIKGDFMGSVEAVQGALENIGNDQARVKIIEAAAGNVTESDFALAHTAGGMIVGFNVSVPKAVVDLNNAAARPVMIHTDTVIYRLIDIVRQGVLDLLPDTFGTKIVSEAEILQIFKFNTKKKIYVNVAGCRVINGTFYKEKSVRIVRGSETIWEGNLESMKFIKKEVEEAKKNTECGVIFDGFEDFRVGDKILGIEKYALPKTL
ncbi:hypothetical protein BT69DRAFT_1212453 [Atractiella rhizophila]|nr:hypothetical protein BT69DRAFT_1212453 [Atractiella rhizophila]